MKSENFKGFIFALIATIAYSNVYIFSKVALNEMHLSQFGMLWYLVVTVACLIFAVWNKKINQIFKLTRKQVLILALLGLLEIGTTTLFFLSIHVIPDPSVTSFLGNMYPVMVMIGGILILNERFGPIEIVGGFLALAGAFVISYSGGTTLNTLFIKGTGIVFLNALLAAIATIVVKIHVKKISPEILNLNRAIWLFLFSSIMFVINELPFSVSLPAFKNLFAGAILEFIAILTIYYSFHYIEASKSSIIQSLKGIVVLLVAYLFFGTMPLLHQVFGGLLTVLGVLIMTLAQAEIFSQKKNAKRIA